MELTDASIHYSKSYAAGELIRQHPPKLRHANKKRVYELACPANCAHTGTIHVSRWRAIALPKEIERESPMVCETREDIFRYEPGIPNTVEWHLNFADCNLFCAYGGPAFAQDEIQVAEHPALGSLAEAMLAENLLPLTMDGRDPSPILISGVERRCAVATDADASRGRPDGLYGRQFARAKTPAIDNAVQLISPPTRSNIIAMAAPTGSGKYSEAEIRFILQTAVTGFSAAKHESSRLISTSPVNVVAHTGFWGCGAFGGHRVLMAVLQLLAARIAKLDKLIFHTVTPDGTASFSSAQKLWTELSSGGNWLQRLVQRKPSESTIPLDEFIAEIHAKGFEWGVGDGN